MLPSLDFHPHHNFHFSQCAYIGDYDGETRIMVDFAPLIGEGVKFWLFHRSGEYLADWVV